MARPKVKIFMTERRDNEMQRYGICTSIPLHQPDPQAQITICHSGRVHEVLSQFSQFVVKTTVGLKKRTTLIIPKCSLFQNRKQIKAHAKKLHKNRIMTPVPTWCFGDISDELTTKCQKETSPVISSWYVEEMLLGEQYFYDNPRWNFTFESFSFDKIPLHIFSRQTIFCIFSYGSHKHFLLFMGLVLFHGY